MDFEESFAAIAVQQAIKTKQSLLDLENELCTELRPIEDPEVVDSSEADVYKDYMVGSMGGYSAHTEEVDEKEITLWKNKFQYLRLTGQGFDLSGMHLAENSSGIHAVSLKQDNEVTSAVSSSCDDDLGSDSLRVYGKRICPMLTDPFHSIPNEEEIIKQHGILEESICIDRRRLESDASSNCDDDVFSSIDPDKSQQAEVINSLVDIIFPETVALSLRPLIERVVRASRQNNIRFESSTDDCCNNSDNENGDFAAFTCNDDSGWAGDNENFGIYE